MIVVLQVLIATFLHIIFFLEFMILGLRTRMTSTGYQWQMVGWGRPFFWNIKGERTDHKATQVVGRDRLMQTYRQNRRTAMTIRLFFSLFFLYTLLMAYLFICLFVCLFVLTQPLIFVSVSALRSGFAVNGGRSKNTFLVCKTCPFQASLRNTLVKDCLEMHFLLDVTNIYWCIPKARH